MSLLPIIGAAAQTILNPILQNAQNQRNREWTKEMYNRQRADAIADWERQNLYNSPQQQMQRLKEAGLNPHLVYGNGVTTTAGDVRSTSPNMAPSKAPEIDTSQLGQSIMQHTDIAQKEVNMDRTRQAMEIGDIQKELLQAQVVKTLADAASTETTTGQKIALFPTNLEIASKRLEQMQADNALKWQKLEQQEKGFVVDLANKILQGHKIESDVKTAAAVRQKIAQDISASISNQTLTELKQISERQKQDLFTEIQQSKIIQNKLDGIKVTHADQQTELNRIKIAMRGAGLSDAALSDLIKAVIQGVGISKGLQNMKPQKPAVTRKWGNPRN